MAFQVDNNVVRLEDNFFDYLLDDEDYDHSLYLVFNKIKYPTITDIAKEVGFIIRRYHKNVKKITVNCRQNDTDKQLDDIIELSCDNISKVILTIPPRTDLLSPVREELYISIVNRNNRFSNRVLARSISDIELDIRNSLLCF